MATLSGDDKHSTTRVGGRVRSRARTAPRPASGSVPGSATGSAIRRGREPGHHLASSGRMRTLKLRGALPSSSRGIGSDASIAFMTASSQAALPLDFVR